MNRLKYKIILLLVTILLITIGTNNFISGYIFKQEYGKAVEKEMFQLGGVVKQQLERILSLGLDIKDIYQFDEICREVAAKNPEVSYVFVFDNTGDLLFRSGSEKPDSITFDNALYKEALESGKETHIGISVENKNYYAALMPVADDANAVQGAVLIAVSSEYIADKTKKLIYYSVLQSFLFFMVSLILLITILTNWVTKPLQAITAIMADAGAGNLNARVKIRSNDEFGALGETLNQMLSKIKELMQSQERATQLQMENVFERERSRLSESLRQALYSLSSTLDEHKVQRLAMEHLKDFVRFSRASLWIYDNGSPELKALHVCDGNMPEMDLDIIHACYRQLVKRGQPVVSHLNGENDSIMAVPIRLHSKLIGMAILEREDRDFEQSEVELALTYTSQAGIAIDNAMMYRQMEKMAVTDELTGMYNRRHFYQLAQQEIELAREHRKPLSVILFDIDYFKQINDRYGHLIGDEVLRRLASTIADVLPAKQIIARFGGEEFVVLLPETDGQAGHRVAERMCRKVFEYVFQTDKGPLQISISLGVAELLGEDSIEMLLHRADEALYAAKAQGRNRAVIIDSSYS
ncbi:diguanylate cyclase [Paenibacillus alkalitolerans]|uniref:diguanylate cyclase n=1 Tax=Paenibacillus alkalitolerans TaxID=2799335 RepID=UPI0018F58417|nr:diguanylate cyclase [Paenibacillus alkalitolerans]